MRHVWENLRRWIALKKRRDRVEALSQALREHQQRLQERVERRTQSLRRLIQRYEDQAHRYYRLNQVALAELALREKTKQQAELEQFEQKILTLSQRVEALQAQRETLMSQLKRRNARARVREELQDWQEGVERVKEEILQLQAQLEEGVDIRV